MTNFRDLKRNPNHPFWDFVAQLDNNNNNNTGASSSRDNNQAPFATGPWGEAATPSAAAESDFEHAADPEEQMPEDPAADEPMNRSSFHDHGPAGRRRHQEHHRHEHHNHNGGPGAFRGRGGGRGGPRGRGGMHHGPPFGGPPNFGGPHFEGPHFGGPRFSRGPGEPPFDFNTLAGWIQDMFVNPRHQDRGTSSDSQDFTPAVDVFSTDAAYLVHVSLAGALKQDIAVNWSAEASTLIISGVITRPGVEGLVQTTSERQVGAFERKISLGLENESIRVDEEGISAKLENGVLKVEVPKLQKDEDFVDVKRVEIE